jgi:hypothetical protein
VTAVLAITKKSILTRSNHPLTERIFLPTNRGDDGPVAARAIQVHS